MQSLPEVIGHHDALRTLPDPLPQTVLITGPAGVGKKRIAFALARRSGAQGIDFQKLGIFNRQASRDLVAFHATTPVTSEKKCSVLDLTEATPEAQHGILTLLEDPPEYSVLVLHTDRTPLLTIRSRCFNMRCGLLTNEEVAQILHGMGVEGSQEAAAASHGRVDLAMEHSVNYEIRRASDVLLQALELRDGRALEDTLHMVLDSEEYRDQLESLVAVLRRAILARQGVVAKVKPEQWSKALTILDRPGRLNLKIRSAVWTLVMGL